MGWQIHSSQSSRACDASTCPYDYYRYDTAITPDMADHGHRQTCMIQQDCADSIVMRGGRREGPRLGGSMCDPIRECNARAWHVPLPSHIRNHITATVLSAHRVMQHKSRQSPILEKGVVLPVGSPWHPQVAHTPHTVAVDAWGGSRNNKILSVENHSSLAIILRMTFSQNNWLSRLCFLHTQNKKSTKEEKKGI